MGVYSLSKKCEIDLESIYEYGIENFGLQKARGYLVGLHELFKLLADNASMGRDASELNPSLKRFFYKSHVIFYIQTATGIYVIRTLHQSMDYSRYF